MSIYNSGNIILHSCYLFFESWLRKIVKKISVFKYFNLIQRKMKLKQVRWGKNCCINIPRYMPVSICVVYAARDTVSLGLGTIFPNLFRWFFISVFRRNATMRPLFSFLWTRGATRPRSRHPTPSAVILSRYPGEFNFDRRIYFTRIHY